MAAGVAVFTTQAVSTPPQCLRTANIVKVTAEYVISYYSDNAAIKSDGVSPRYICITERNTENCVSTLGPLPGQILMGIELSSNGKILVTQEDYSIDNDIGLVGLCYDMGGNLLWSHKFIGDNTHMVISSDGNLATFAMAQDLVFLSGETGKPINLSKLLKSIPKGPTPNNRGNDSQADPSPKGLSSGNGLVLRTRGYIGGFMEEDFFFLIPDRKELASVRSRSMEMRLQPINSEYERIVLPGISAKDALTVSPDGKMMAIAVSRTVSREKETAPSGILMLDRNLDVRISPVSGHIQKIEALSYNQVLYSEAKRSQASIVVKDLDSGADQVIERNTPSSAFSYAIKQGSVVQYGFRITPTERTVEARQSRRYNLESKTLDVVPSDKLTLPK